MTAVDTPPQTAAAGTRAAVGPAARNPHSPPGSAAGPGGADSSPAAPPGTIPPGLRPRVLDLYCCQGGAAMGYHRAGYDVLGIDREPQPRYPFPMVQADALEFLASADLSGFALIHGSPPCQDHSETQIITGDHGTGWLLAATRDALKRTGLPWVIENVQGAPLAHQTDLFGANGLVLCGCMFPELRGLLYEDRVFETSHPLPQPPHVRHQWRQTKMGRPPRPGECMQVTGHFSDVPEARRRMSAGWMNQDGLAQAIPPAYTRYIGGQLLAAGVVAAAGPAVPELSRRAAA